MMTVVSCCLPLRKKPRVAFDPGLREAMSATSSAPFATFLPSMERDGVADFQTSLVGRASGYDARYRNSRPRAIHAHDRRIFHRIKGDADRAPSYAVFRPGQLVVHIDHGLRR